MHILEVSANEFSLLDANETILESGHCEIDGDLNENEYFNLFAGLIMARKYHCKMLTIHGAREFLDVLEDKVPVDEEDKLIYEQCCELFNYFESVETVEVEFESEDNDSTLTNSSDASQD